jgi:excisionase family DNA binding protein
MTTLDPGVTGRRQTGRHHSKKRKKKTRRPPHPQAQTMSVPEAGAKYLGLSKNASYEAAERGDIPTIKIGKLLRVPVRAMEQILDKACRLPAAGEDAE